jgi:DMSO/TMAO reductase YedYZ molybdopterin-dependent catalytic subunit
VRTKPNLDNAVNNQVSGDGYTTVIQREDLVQSDAFFAIFYQSPDIIIPHEHGGPRIIAPHLFGWKSAKCVRASQ